MRRDPLRGALKRTLAEGIRAARGGARRAHELRTDSETIEIARTAQRALAATGDHRVPIPDLLIAACAQQDQAAVLHRDRHYEALERALAFTPVRLEV